jgi:hypothetical protein
VRTDIAAHAEELARLLHETRARIRLHLAIEDRFLYPQLHASRDPRMTEAATRLSSELGTIAATYDRFLDRFGSTESIRQAPAEFLREARAIHRALEARVEREEADLYPLAGML